MSIYAKTWCPAYPCDPCLVGTTGSMDNIGSDSGSGPIPVCPGGGTLSANLLRVTNIYESPNVSQYYSGVRKWSLAVETIPHSAPSRFALLIVGSMIGSPLPISEITVSYGGNIVLTVPGPVVVAHQNVSVVEPGVQNFIGYMELLPDDQKNCIQWAYGSLMQSYWGETIDGQPAIGPRMEWHYDGPIYPGEPVTIKYRLPGVTNWACNGSHFAWQQNLYSQFVFTLQEGINFWRTKCNELW